MPSQQGQKHVLEQASTTHRKKALRKNLNTACYIHAEKKASAASHSVYWVNAVQQRRSSDKASPPDTPAPKVQPPNSRGPNPGLPDGAQTKKAARGGGRAGGAGAAQGGASGADAESPLSGQRRPILPRACPSVLSAMEGLTAGFGMGPGVPPPPWPLTRQGAL